MSWKSSEFDSVQEADYFICISYANHGVEFYKKYTEMIFNFYDHFFPGITVYQEGRIKVEELKSIYDNIILSSSDKTDEAWEILEAFISSEIARLQTSHADGLIDFYDARRFLHSAITPISSVSNGLNAFHLHDSDGEKLVDVDDWCDFVHLKGNSYFYSDYYAQLDKNDNGRICITEIQKRYKAVYDSDQGDHGFLLNPEEYGVEIARRYDINDNKALTFDEAKEWAFCLAPYLDDPAHIEPGTCMPGDPCDPDGEKIIPVVRAPGPDEPEEPEVTTIVEKTPEPEATPEPEVVEVTPEPIRPDVPDVVGNTTSSSSSSSSSSSDSDFEPVKEKPEEPETTTFVDLGDEHDPRCCAKVGRLCGGKCNPCTLL